MTKLKSPFLNEMIDRGFFNQCTNLEGLDDLMSSGPITAYAGFDATADSLHIGHLISLMVLRKLARHGHNVIALVGGATSRIGDPSFRSDTRKMLGHDDVDRNLQGIAANIKTVLGDFGDKVRFLDNWEWLGGVGFLQFMRDVGAHFSVGRMLSMDSVKSRLEGNSPLSALEFSYMMLQAADFEELAKRHDCRLQVGGSDQWGNIVNGIELARRRNGPELFGLTTKLLTTRDGRKMGKTEGGAVWLSADKLSPFDFWQFWRNVDDADVQRFLLLFTDTEAEEIAGMVGSGRDINKAKIVLADAVTSLVHGSEAADSARAKAVDLFSIAPTEVTESIETGGQGIGLLDLIVRLGMATRTGEARRLVEGNAVRLDGAGVQDWRTYVAPSSGCLVEVGKRKKSMVAIR